MIVGRHQTVTRISRQPRLIREIRGLSMRFAASGQFAAANDRPGQRVVTACQSTQHRPTRRSVGGGTVVVGERRADVTEQWESVSAANTGASATPR
jgi:hypothetical protein